MHVVLAERSWKQTLQAGLGRPGPEGGARGQHSTPGARTQQPPPPRRSAPRRRQSKNEHRNNQLYIYIYIYIRIYIYIYISHIYTKKIMCQAGLQTSHYIVRIKSRTVVAEQSLRKDIIRGPVVLKALGAKKNTILAKAEYTILLGLPVFSLFPRRISGITA